MNETIQFIRLPEVVRLLGLSRSTIYSKLNPNSPSYDPTFPRQIPLSPKAKRGAVAWNRAEIVAWQLAQINNRD